MYAKALLKELGLREEDIFTEFTASSFFSPNGLEVRPQSSCQLRESEGRVLSGLRAPG